MNKHDSERVSGMLQELGLRPVETIPEADIAIFMTCCVREKADERLMGQVSSMKNIPLFKLFEPHQGNAIYTKKNILEAKKIDPV